jgi:hypothetical protein
MDEPEDVLELERKIAQASRIAQYVPDPTTYERLKAWVEELRQGLRQLRAVRRNREEITARARAQAAIWSFGFRPSPRSAARATKSLDSPRR